MVVIIGRGSRDDLAAILLETRKKRHIPNERRPELLPERMAAAVRLHESRFTSVRNISATAIYNCAGLVFGCRRTTIDIENIRIPLADDAFQKLNDPSEWEIGDVVVYRDRNGRMTHVGVIHDIHVDRAAGGPRTVTVISAWGEDGEYIHRADEVPELLGRMTEVWSQRKVAI